MHQPDSLWKSCSIIGSPLSVNFAGDKKQLPPRPPLREVRGAVDRTTRETGCGIVPVNATESKLDFLCGLRGLFR
jgi:hypothetical protein